MYSSKSMNIPVSNSFQPYSQVMLQVLIMCSQTILLSRGKRRLVELARFVAKHGWLWTHQINSCGINEFFVYVKWVHPLFCAMVQNPSKYLALHKEHQL